MSNSSAQKEATRAVDYKQLRISSTAFDNNQAMPLAYTCDGRNISPPLDIEHIPEDAKSLALIVDDPDAQGGTWTHWVAWNIPLTHYIRENEIHGTVGLNDFKKHYYRGPCPPSGTHHYYFKLYALDTLLELPVSAGKVQLEKAMSGHIIAFGELTGLYARKK